MLIPVCNHEFAPIFTDFANSVHGWFSLINIVAVECQGDNYSVCHRAPFWVPNYPTFRLFCTNDKNDTFGGYEITEKQESKRGLTELVVDFLTKHPSRRWIFTECYAFF